MIVMRFSQSFVAALMMASLTLTVAQGQETPGKLVDLPKCDLPSPSSVLGQHPPQFAPEWICPGVTLYRHQSEFVQVIELDQGASVHFLSGDITDPRQGQGAYGGDDPELLRQTAGEAWSEFIDTYPEGVCLTNGQFFRNDANAATELAFPVKGDDRVVSDGYAGETEYPTEKLMLEVWLDHAQIRPFTPELMQTSTAPNMIVSLTPTADKDPQRATGRTFIGVQDQDGDQRSETVLILTGKSLTQPQATQILKDFGAGQIIMLDGGGSTQLFCQGIPYLESPRTVPQMIGVTMTREND